MTGVRIDVEVDDNAVRQAFDRLEALVDDMTPVFDEIGRTVVDHAILRFERQVDPDGRAWQPLAPATIQARRGGGVDAKILIDSARLMQSLTHHAERDRVTVGTNVVYAAIHQLGGQAGRNRATTIPARPFLGLDRSDREDILDIVSRHLEEALQ